MCQRDACFSFAGRLAIRPRGPCYFVAGHPVACPVVHLRDPCSFVAGCLVICQRSPSSSVASHLAIHQRGPRSFLTGRSVAHLAILLKELYFFVFLYPAVHKWVPCFTRKGPCLAGSSSLLPSPWMGPCLTGCYGLLPARPLEGHRHPAPPVLSLLSHQRGLYWAFYVFWTSLFGRFPVFWTGFVLFIWAFPSPSTDPCLPLFLFYFGISGICPLYTRFFHLSYGIFCILVNLSDISSYISVFITSCFIL